MRFLELKIPPVLLVLGLGTLMWLTTRSTPRFGLVPPGRVSIAAVLLLAGLIIAVAGVIAFRRAKTTVNPLQPADASHLVTSGVYRLTRNPMYLGMLLTLLSWAVWLAHPVALIVALVFVPLMNRLQILPEERALIALFGSAFADYQAAVRRWL